MFTSIRKYYFYSQTLQTQNYKDFTYYLNIIYQTRNEYGIWITHDRGTRGTYSLHITKGSVSVRLFAWPRPSRIPPHSFTGSAYFGIPRRQDEVLLDRWGNGSHALAPLSLSKELCFGKSVSLIMFEGKASSEVRFRFRYVRLAENCIFILLASL